MEKVRKKNKNKQTFAVVVQTGRDSGIRVYRIMQNKPKSIGFIEFPKSLSWRGFIARFDLGRLPKVLNLAKNRDIIIIKFLKKNGHIKEFHVHGEDYNIFTL